MFGNLFGGGGDSGPRLPAGMSDHQISNAEGDARRMTAATPQEIELMKKLGISAEAADANMLEELRALRARGEDLSNVDQAYMDRAYKPAFDRLMTDYGDLDRGILEDMNRRGITSVPGGASEPEMYQRSLLSRDTKRTLGNTMLDAQNQAVQQKLAQYQGRLAETEAGARRYDQTMTPYRDLTAVSETDRMGNRVGAAGNIYNARLGYEAKMHDINSQRMMQNKQNTMNLIGAGLGVAGGAFGMMSDPELKTDREPGPDPEQDLQELSQTPTDRWKFRWEGEETPMHQGAMSDEAPPDIQTPDGKGLDIHSYFGKITNALKALNNRTSTGAYGRMMESMDR